MTLGFALLSYMGSAVYHRAGGVTTVKPLCGVALAICLIYGRRALWPVLITGLLGGIAAKHVFNATLYDTLATPLLAVASLYVTHWLLQRMVSEAFSFRSWRHLIGFIAISAATSAASAVLFAFVLDPPRGTGTGWDNWMAWFLPTTLSYVLFTPALVLLATADRAVMRRNARKLALCTLALTGVLAGLFVPTNIPLTSTIPLALVLITLACEIEGAALGLLVTQIIISACTVAGLPLSALVWFPMGQQLYFTQIFLGILVGVMLPAAAAISERRTLKDAITDALHREEKVSLALRASEAKYRAKAEEAAAASHAKSDFLASMSHELRTPLNAILGFSDIIKAEMFGPLGHPKYREYADDVYRSGTHLLDLINDVLDLSKIDAGKMELRERRFALEELVGEAVALLRDRAAGRMTLKMDMPRDLPHVLADFRLVKQILINLLSNALKFTPDGGMVTISARPAPDGGLWLQVTDNGIGMNTAQLEKAFSQYGQIDSHVARSHQGTGLGLPISRALARLHGGELLAESWPGSGTRMTLALPPSRVVPGQAASQAMTG